MRCVTCNGTGEVSATEHIQNLLRGTVGLLDGAEIPAACRYLGRAQQALEDPREPRRPTVQQRVAHAVYAIDRGDYSEAAHYLTEAISEMG